MSFSFSAASVRAPSLTKALERASQQSSRCHGWEQLAGQGCQVPQFLHQAERELSSRADLGTGHERLPGACHLFSELHHTSRGQLRCFRELWRIQANGATPLKTFVSLFLLNLLWAESPVGAKQIFFFFLNLCLYLVHMKKPKQMEFGGWTVSRKSLIPINACPWLQSFFNRRAKEIKNKVGKKKHAKPRVRLFSPLSTGDYE